MPRYSLRTLLILTTFVAGCTDQQSTGVFVTSARFGLVQPDGSIVETTRISREPGTRYGWSLEVTPTTKVTRIKEVFTLPQGEKFGPKPKSEPDAIRVVEYSISDDGRIQTEVFEVISRRSFTVVENYSVSGDDSGGHCVIELYVNDILVSTFAFDVVE
jgi:hypothetical protein